MAQEPPSNSRKNKETPITNLPKGAEEKKSKGIEKVISGEVVTKKPSLGTRFKETFFSDDIGGVGRYLVLEVLLPAARNLVVDSVNKGIERAIYGDTMSHRRRADPMYRYSYNRSPLDKEPRRGYLPDQPPPRPTHASRGVRKQAVGDIIIASRDEAEIVLERLGDLIDQFDFASIADLYELLGLPHTYIDNKWGWDDIKDSDVRQVREGYLIMLPAAEQID